MGSDTLELMILVALAAVVLYRLRMVIGTRTGHEAPPDYLRRREGTAARRPKPVAVPDPADDEDDGDVPGASRAALAEIRSVEPDFAVDEFLDGARGAYEMILMAYEESDRETLSNLLAPDVLQAFEGGIDSREEQGLRVEARFIGVREAAVEDIRFESDTNIADVTVRFVGELITAVRDADNRIVEGDPNESRRQTDVWTFSREMGASDPNWLLIGTGA